MYKLGINTSLNSPKFLALLIFDLRLAAQFLIIHCIGAYLAIALSEVFNIDKISQLYMLKRQNLTAIIGNEVLYQGVTSSGS